jgi:hypothetical protein
VIVASAASEHLSADRGAGAFPLTLGEFTQTPRDRCTSISQRGNSNSVLG